MQRKIMNKYSSHRYSIALTLLLSIITPVSSFSNAPAQTVPTEQNIHGLYQEILEPFFTQAMAQLNTLDCMLQDLAFNVANNTAITTKSRSQAINKIRTIREQLFNIHAKQHVVLDEQLIYTFIFIARSTISHITQGLQHGIDSLEVIDFASIKIPNKAKITIEDLQKELSQNEILIKALEKASDNMDLHWYNKAYRAFKYLVVEPAKAIAPTAIIGASLGAAAFCGWYYFGGNTLRKLREKVGWPQDSDIIDQQKQNATVHYICDQFKKNHIDESLVKKIDEENSNDRDIQAKPVGWLGRLEQTLFRFQTGRFAVGLAMVKPAQILLEYWYSRLGHSIVNKINAFDNFLMGGSYKNRSTGDITEKSDVTFDALIGQEDAKQYGRELCQYIKNPELFERTKTAPVTGVLLYGDTRTGKSFFISALQGEIQKTLGKEAAFKVWKVSFELILKEGIHAIMEAARTEAPMIVVIEEIDLLKLQRIGDHKLLAEFMTEMSSCLQENRPGKTVIIIGTTNKLENIEPALRQEGRFGRHIYFDYPKFNERVQFISQELTRTACTLEHFDINKLARDTEGCSFEKLRLFIKRTFMRAKLYGEQVSQLTLEQSIDENIRGISLGKVTLDQEQKQLIAAHLAGHTVATMLLDSHQKISKVTLRDVACKIEEEYVGRDLVYKNEKQAAFEHGKIFASHDRDMSDIESKDEKIKQCKIWLAGHVAERILLGSCGYGYHAHDREVALKIAQLMTHGKIDLTTMPKKMRDQYYEQAFMLLNKCEEEITKLLEDHRTELSTVMNELVEKLTLDTQDLRRIIFGEQNIIQLDANNLLASLLKNQTNPEQLQDQVLTNTATAAG